MKLKNLLVSGFLLSGISLFAQDSYNYTIDLKQIEDDKATVELITPKVDEKTTTFHLPKIVPGTYSVYDFGRFVSDFQAFDKKGKKLKVKKTDDNSWQIKKAHKMTRITYKVDDTFDSELENPIFEPGGTNFEAANYSINNHSVFGFLKGKEFAPFNVTYKKSSEFAGYTTLKEEKMMANSESYSAKSYHELIDNPIMLADVEAVELQIGNCAVEVAVYSPNEKVSAEFIAGEVEPVLNAIKDYLGGTLPVDEYAFLIYLADGRGASGGFGALEHSKSSFYFLPEMEPSFIAQTVRDVAAHEFLHIVTPLNIHSEEIHYFDFINPKMSQHLWLYEGVTEYTAHHVQVNQGILSREKYLEKVAGEMVAADGYDQSIPFTTMSLGCLDEHKDEYGNVYQKGALIGMCLDLKLNHLSKGKYSLKQLIQELSNEFGPDKPFKDEELFAKITELTYPEIATFFEKHVAGNEPLPYGELLSTVGVDYSAGKTIQDFTLGGVQIGYNGTNFIVASTEKMNAFGQKMGYEDGDVLKAVNGTELTIANVQAFFDGLFTDAKEGDKLEVLIVRNEEEKTLSAPLMKVEKKEAHKLAFKDKLSDDQKMLQQAWLGDTK